VLVYTDEGEMFMAKGVPNSDRTRWDWSSLQLPKRMSAFGDAAVDYSLWKQNQTLSIYHQQSPKRFLQTDLPHPVDGFPTPLRVSTIDWEKLATQSDTP
jgi:hypothetical protein